MTMRASSRRELYKLRELVHFLLAGAGATPRENKEYGDPSVADHTVVQGAFCCFFCREKLEVSEKASAGNWLAHGNAVGPKLEEKITIHHINGDHDDNRDENKALCHLTCHKSFHRKQANTERELKKRLAQQGGVK